MFRAVKQRWQGRRGSLLWLAGAAVVIAAAVATVLLVGHSSHSPAPSLPAATGGDALALTALQSHTLLAPECTPIKGPRWSYPGNEQVGPGLQPIHAHIASDLYEVFAINGSCVQATTWTRKLDLLRIPVQHSGNVDVIKGPAGYYCSAWPDANGRAYAGGCQSKGGKGNQAFGWNWNVANRRVVFQPDEQTGKVVLIRVTGDETSVVLHYLPKGYDLDVSNTSGIGYLNQFTWLPSPGWKVTKLTKVSGAKCKLTAAGAIVCTGTIAPPKCLCAGNGGTVSIKFSAVPTTKKHGYLFGGAPIQFQINRMTPVPYIIPGTPAEATKRGGV